MPEPIDILREAREYYREHGGAQHTFTDNKTGKVCAFKAWIDVGRKHYDTEVLIDIPEMATAKMALAGACEDLHGHPAVMNVNDKTDDPYPVIMDLYDHAIKVMENENA